MCEQRQSVGGGRMQSITRGEARQQAQREEANVEAKHRAAHDSHETDEAYGQTGTGLAGEGVLVTRREFLAGALTVSGLALSGFPGPAAAPTPAPAPPPTGS